METCESTLPLRCPPCAASPNSENAARVVSRVEHTWAGYCTRCFAYVIGPGDTWSKPCTNNRVTPGQTDDGTCGGIIALHEPTKATAILSAHAIGGWRAVDDMLRMLQNRKPN